jgi:diguanylate cyclase (GGDEF)-like protein
MALMPGTAGPVAHLYLLPVLLTAFVLGRGATLALLALIVVGRLAVGFATGGLAWLSFNAGVALFVELSPTLLVAFLTGALASDLHVITGRLRHLEERDALTGLLNLAAFGTRLAAVDRRTGPGDSYALLMVDVDELKQINERFGYEAGDRALRTVAESLTRATRDTDTCARFGSDEFVIYLPGGTRESADIIANRIRHQVFSATQDFDYAMRRLTVSIGVAVHGEDGSDPRALMQAAASAVREDRVARLARSSRLSTAAAAD